MTGMQQFTAILIGYLTLFMCTATVCGTIRESKKEKEKRRDSASGNDRSPNVP